MTKKTISELNDVLLTQESIAVVAIEQNGATFKAPVRPNPPFQVNVSSQAQLEAEFGVNIEIPDGEEVTIVVDTSFTLSKPFKIGLGSSLEIYGSTAGLEITWTGTGAIFQNETFANQIEIFDIHNLRIIGDDTNDGFELNANRFFMTRTEFMDINQLGTIENASILIEDCGFGEVKQGLSIINPQIAGIKTTAVFNFVKTSQMTLFGFILNNPVPINLDGISGLGFEAGDGLVFFDPNSPAGSAYTIANSSVDGGDFFKPGTDFAVDQVMVGTTGPRFRTVGTNNYRLGQQVVLSGFTEPTYNGTFRISNIATGVQFEIDIAFVADDTGNVNAVSLDQTDNRVTARNNPGQADSMFLAEGRSVGTLLVDSILSTLVPIVDVTPVSGDFEQDVGTERFTVNPTTGLITYTGLEPITALISYELNAEKASGADQNLVISLEINGTPQTKSDINLLAPATPGLFGTSGRKIYTIVNGDTFQLFLNNITNSTDTNVTKLALVISRQ